MHRRRLAANDSAVDIPVRTSDPAAVEAAVLDLFHAAFPEGPTAGISRVFARAAECFAGRFPGYQAVDVRYHDLEHTLQGTLCLARLLRGRQRAGATPTGTAELFELAITAALLHDTGYLKTRDDTEGTGAKYTVTHVARSAEFAARLLPSMGFTPSQIQSVQNMIRCTGVNADLAGIPFRSELERLHGFAVATADLLGQMAADDYPEKLPQLFEEFAESARFSGPGSPTGAFATAPDLIARTPEFWERYVKPKLEKQFAGVFRFLNQPPPAGRNDYLERVEANITRIRRENPPAA